VRATVAPPTTVNRACYWRQNLIQLLTVGLATMTSAPGQQRTQALQQNGVAVFDHLVGMAELPSLAAARGAFFTGVGFPPV